MDSVINLYAGERFLVRMIKEDIVSPEELWQAVRKLGNFASGHHIFKYKGIRGNIKRADYETFKEFKNDLYEVDVIAVGASEIVNFT